MTEDKRLGIGLLVVVVNVSHIEVLLGDDDSILVVVAEILQEQGMDGTARKVLQPSSNAIGSRAFRQLTIFLPSAETKWKNYLTDLQTPQLQKHSKCN